jgi:hypothetical protein
LVAGVAILFLIRYFVGESSCSFDEISYLVSEKKIVFGGR